MYSQPITHLHRTAFVLAIDCSGSMRERIVFNGMPMSKAEAVALVTDYTIDELIERARRGGVCRNYYDIAVVGYSGDGVRSMLPAPHEDFAVAVDALSRAMPPLRRMEFDQRPAAGGLTPMYEALLTVRDIVDEWCSRAENAESFPPVVFNITDGESSDGDYDDLCDMASQIRRTGTADGETLLINIHLSTDSSRRSILFPSSRSECGEDRYSQLLYDMSSTMPEPFVEGIRSLTGALGMPPMRGMAYNASAAQLLSVLDIGSRSVNNIY